MSLCTCRQVKNLNLALDREKQSSSSFTVQFIIQPLDVSEYCRQVKNLNLALERDKEITLKLESQIDDIRWVQQNTRKYYWSGFPTSAFRVQKISPPASYTVTGTLYSVTFCLVGIKSRCRFSYLHLVFQNTWFTVLVQKMWASKIRWVSYRVRTVVIAACQYFSWKINFLW